MGRCSYHPRCVPSNIPCWEFRFSNKELGQWTPQAQKLYDLLIAIVSSNDRAGLADLEALKKNSGLDSTEWEDLLQYTAQVPFSSKIPHFIKPDFAFQVLGNLVNYKSFGFTKIIPRLAPDRFEAVVSNSTNKEKALPLWNDVRLCYPH